LNKKKIEFLREKERIKIATEQRAKLIAEEKAYAKRESDILAKNILTLL
jgi:hypothetical protein